MKFRYQTEGRWFKGNTHLHSTASDGGCTFPELAEHYAQAGYDFLFRTDHWIASDCRQDAHPYPLLWLDGVELDCIEDNGTINHIVCLGRVTGIDRKMGFAAALQSARDQGCLTILAHPLWSGNALSDAERWKVEGVEIYNHVCHWGNGKSCGQAHWNAALQRDARTLAFAADDTHMRPDCPSWNGGWIMVNTNTLTPEAILQAIRLGHYYSSCGPAFKSITTQEDQIIIKTSPVRFARLVGPRAKGIRKGAFNDRPMQSFAFPIPKDWDYVYLEIEDVRGKRAWTNSLFVNP